MVLHLGVFIIVVNYTLSVGTYSVLITIRISDAQTDVHFVRVDSESVTHNMRVLLMFRSVMVHVQGNYVFLGRTIS